MLHTLHICAVNLSRVGKPFDDATLDRGPTTIPLASLDVPFHSRYLWSGVMPSGEVSQLLFSRLYIAK